MPNHAEIYRRYPEQYHQLIAAQPDLRHDVQRVFDYADKDIVDLGAGTGRLTAQLAPLARSITALDQSEAMLDINKQRLLKLGLSNWQVQQADHRQLPLSDNSADLITAGWTLCYLAADDQPDWARNLELMMSEIQRVLRQDGTVLIFETMGTLTSRPEPPAFLKAYYHALELEYRFVSRAIRLDYQFASVDEAEACAEFFFGSELARRIRNEQLTTVQEWAGMWWRRNSKANWRLSSERTE
ncbi:MAG: class I SAM-dependent methyltransferase [Paenibacillus sp.]|nr:class I SAM-dependent methyltransferase [Paenibacillus sp.]